jgi:hypothetical protein
MISKMNSGFLLEINNKLITLFKDYFLSSPSSIDVRTIAGLPFI